MVHGYAATETIDHYHRAQRLGNAVGDVRQRFAIVMALSHAQIDGTEEGFRRGLHELSKSLTEWGRVLHDSALAAALADRLLHHGEVYYLTGDSYRLRGKPRSTEGPEEADAAAAGG